MQMNKCEECKENFKAMSIWQKYCPKCVKKSKKEKDESDAGVKK